MKTQKEYLSSSGQCPFCNNSNTGTSGVVFLDKRILHQVFCNKCTKEWNDIYTLSGFKQSKHL
ncbi:MAG TPA: hypothetical protein ENI76_05805 [Ignavibacteria bacterium]|nr:hypothetical protein [Ignavibacteria bacterium]